MFRRKLKQDLKIQVPSAIMRVLVALFLLSANGLFSQVSQSQEQDDFNYGERLYNEGFFDLAAMQFQKFTENFPTSPRAAEAQFLIGQCAYENRRYEEAQMAFLKVILKYPVSPLTDDAQFRIAESFESMGDHEAARASYQRLYDDYPDSENALESLFRSAQISMKLKHFRTGASVLRHLLEQAHSGEYRSKASLLLSDLYYESDDFENAALIIRTLLSHPIRDDDPAEGNFRLGKIHEAMGLYQESQAFYKNVVSLAAGASLHQLAYFRLGVIYDMFGEDALALEAFQNVTTGEGDASIQSNAFFMMGWIKKRSNDLSGALEAFEKSEALNPKSNAKFKTAYQRATCLETLGRSSEAVAGYESLVRDTTVDEQLRKQSLLSLGSLHRLENRFARAVAVYDDYLTHFQMDPMVDKILLVKGQICLHHLGYLEEGFSTLRKLWREYPTSPIVPGARTSYARGLEKTGNLKEALQVYRTVVEKYPMTPSAQFAQNRIRAIELFHPLNYETGVSTLTAFAQRLLINPDDDAILLDMGRVCFHDLHRYEAAVSFFSRYLEAGARSENRDEALFYIARSYEILLKNDTDVEAQNRVIDTYQKFLWESPDSRWADDAALRLIDIKAMLPMEDRPGEAVYIDFLNRYPESAHRAEIHYRWALANIDRDSLELALDILDNHMRLFPESPYREQILYQSGKMRFQTGDFNGADSVFQVYLNDCSEGRFMPEILLHLARITSMQGDDSTAVSRLETIIDRHPSSAWADSARIHMGRLYLKNEQYHRCIPLYLEALKNDSLTQWSVSVGLADSAVSQRRHYLLGLARAYQGMGKYKQAKYAYFKYFQENQSPEDLVLVYTALSRIAEDEGRIAHAEAYMNRILAVDESAQSIESVGNLRFRLERYEEAITSFDRALTMTKSDEAKASISAKIIISLMRQGKVPQAEVRMNLFTQSFRSLPMYREWMAEFLLEKGIAHIQAKSFESAQEALEEVIQGYRNTRFGPRAEFEMARVNLITNKIEDALRMLTGMVDRYPHHPILARVYLNLGVHYFQSRQFENAMRAFRLAMENEEAPEIVPVAMRELIKVYDALGMWDAALHRTREYIRRFPEAEDLMQKRVQIGNFYMDLNEYNRAIEVFRDVKKDADYETQAEIQYWIGQCYYRMGQFERAIFEFMRVGTLTRPTKLPWGTTALYDAGQAYLKLDRPELARQLFEKVVQKDGSTGDMGRIARQRVQEIDALLKKRE